MRLALCLAVITALAPGCFDLTLPPQPPPPGPGTIQGRVVYAVPGRSDVRAAGGAEVVLLARSASTVADAETGRFVLGGIVETEGQLLLRFDVDADGVFDRQRVLDLKAIQAGPGRDLELGDVALARNAVLLGQVVRGDSALAGGHAGTTVFVPGAPYLTSTADDGSFMLSQLPEGPLSVAFFREGFAIDGREVQLVGGQEARLSTVTLQPGPAGVAQVRGQVRLASGQPAGGARVRLASRGMEAVATAGDDGLFTVEGLPATLYQAAVERAEATSLRLYNLFLLQGANDLGVLVLSPGTSTPISLDGGVVPGEVVDAGPPPVVAVVTPQIVEVAPGGAVVLSGGRSSGVAPLVYRWRFDVDSGVGTPSFALNDTTSAVNGAFTAPDASVLLPVELTVTDALLRPSAPTRALVRVGRAPRADLVIGGPATVTGGDAVTLSGLGSVSTDGRPLVVYRWRQVTGPFSPEVAMAVGPQVSFVAPAVLSPTPMSVELSVVTDLGFASAPASVTLVIQPRRPWGLRVDVSPPDGGSFGPDGGSVVRLTAVLSDAPPDAGFTFSWNPTLDGCGLPDGGLDVSCAFGFVLSNPSSAETEFVVPRTDGTTSREFTVVVTNAVDNSQRTARAAVVFHDARPPQCSTALSPLTLRVECDEELGDAGVVTLGAPVARFTTVTFGRGLAALVSPTLAVAAQVPVTVQGLTDRAGNLATPFSGQLAVQHQYGPVYVSADTSVEEPRPRWVTPSSTMPPMSQRWLAGRRVSGGNRSAWVIDGNSQCMNGPCVVPSLPASAMSIPGAGTTPLPSDGVTSVGDRVYVTVSSSMPVGLVQVQGSQAQELMGTPPPLTLASNGTALQVVSAAPDGGLERFQYNATGNAFSLIDSVSLPAVTFSSGSLARLELFKGGAAVLAATSATGAVAYFVNTGGGGAPLHCR